ncbi:RNA-binding protein nanos [Lasioglossum baleicum]|uniref:RNA-binding protein nanos n=1 Tax=Lasioglossum baleicum TaxID=434251 RepID=UPI003FCE3134
MTKIMTMQTMQVSQMSYVFYPFNSSLDEEIKRLFQFRFDLPAPPKPNVEDVMEEFRHNGRDFEYCPDPDDSATLETTPRRKKNKKPLPTECVFCRNNGEEEIYYKKHLLKDAEGKVRCPVLRAYTCPICGVSGDEAHTIKYCPKSPKSSSTIATANAFKVMRNSTGKRRVK